MVNFVGAGCGAKDLITVRGQRLLQQADVVIYAGSLVNPALLEETREGCETYDSAKMTLDEVLAVMERAEERGLMTVRLHTGDPSVYGAIREQMDRLSERGIPYEVCPGVSSFCGAAASLRAELTLPEVSQTVILTRLAGRTRTPKKESFRALAAHHATMAVFLSAGMLKELEQELKAAGYEPETPAAIVYKATWPDEKTIRCTVSTLWAAAEREGITKTAIILIGDVLGSRKQNGYADSRLYAADFTTGFRKGRDKA
ncbi:MAG: precorrin-4 C(11)-methyltransferase [Lachnospiraceae bacterium]|nr:precorrin-4 C(11)-methyltransferase [Lachnospiraceae bacterium]